MVHQPPLWVPVPVDPVQVQAPEQLFEQPQSQPRTLPEPETNPLDLISLNLEASEDEVSENEVFEDGFEEQEPCEKPKIIPSEPFPFGHLTLAVNHFVNWKSFTWKPLNETPVKGQKHVFANLPYDIQFECVRLLDYLSILRLARTNRFFHQLLDPRRILTQTEIAEFVTKCDNFEPDRPRTSFACYSCFKFLPKSKFTRKAIKSKDERYCFDCAVDMRWYPHLCPVSNGKFKYFFCHNCKTYGTESVRCRGKRVCDGGFLFTEMDEAWALCHKKPERNATQLETLPIHLLKNIAKFLTYKDLLKFTEVSHTLYEKIEHDWAPLHDRFRCMNKKWETEQTKDFETIDKFPCFMCLEWKPRYKFTKTQIKKAEACPETSWKLRCQSCLHYQYSTSRSPIRAEYQRRQMCSTCKCIKAGGTTCGGCLELYLDGVITRDIMYPVRNEANADYEWHLRHLDGVFREEGDEEFEDDEDSGWPEVTEPDNALRNMWEEPTQWFDPEAVGTEYEHRVEEIQW